MYKNSFLNKKQARNIFELSLLSIIFNFASFLILSDIFLSPSIVFLTIGTFIETIAVFVFFIISIIATNPLFISSFFFLVYKRMEDELDIVLITFFMEGISKLFEVSNVFE